MPPAEAGTSAETQSVPTLDGGIISVVEAFQW